MIRTPHFFEDERDSPLLARNYRFVNPQTIEALTARVEALKDLLTDEETLAAVNAAKTKEPTTDESMLRIFRKDAERTYVEKSDEVTQARTLERQDRHVEILAKVGGVMNDYHQGMGYIASFLGLFQSVDQVVEIMLYLHFSPKHSSGYFSATPARFVADGRVLTDIIKTADEQLVSHISNHGILPEMYMSKWFIGLGLHVLPFEHLIEFYELYLSKGVSFLFAFGFAYLNKFRTLLIAAKSTASLMTILRAEDDTADWKLPKSIDKATLGEVVNEAVAGIDSWLPADLTALRQVELEKVNEQIRKAKQRDDELKKLYADDEDSENWSDDE
jgi:hypothetical protein